MEPMEYIALAAAASKLIQSLLPQIRDLIHGGALTPEQEAQARADYAAYRALGGNAYAGPEYDLSGR